MAVFPERIILKSSSDNPADIITAIQSGGSDEIATGEIVVGNLAGNVKLFTLDSNGDVIAIGGVGVGSGGGDGEGGGGRGDGGDFDNGTVDITFAFGVYGGGDFNAGSEPMTAVAPFAHARLDAGNISTITSHDGMSSAAHVFSSGVSSYTDFTFDTAQPDTDYSVQATWTIGPEFIEINNKTTTGFRANFYDLSTGNHMGSGSVAVNEPVFVVYDSDPTVSISNSDGVDLPVELLGDNEGPDGGTF